MGQESLQKKTAFVFPTSFAQQRLWFLDQLEPGSTAYVLVTNIRFTARLDIAALSSSLNEIVRRHEMLRTTFTAVDGQPVQVVAPDGHVTLAQLDLRTLPRVEQEAAVEQLAYSEARRSFDLGQGPLLHCTLLRFDEEAYGLVLTIHHIASDGWSLGVFFNELAALYPAFAAGTPSPLPDLPIQYADFAAWQRDWLEGPQRERLLTYWKQQLAGLPALQLPFDRLSTPLENHHGVRHSFALPRELVTALATVGQQEGCTLFMTLLAAFFTLLYRYSGQEDVAVGVPIANRTRTELEGLIGFFVNTLVLRGDLTGDPPFRVLLRRVRELTLDAYAHQDLPFEKLVEELRPDRDLGRNPLVQVMFHLQNAPRFSSASGAIARDVQTEAAHFDLALDLWDGPDGLLGSWEYRSDLWTTDSIRRLTANWEVLLNGIASEPEWPLSMLSLLTEGEQQLVEAWGAAPAAPPVPTHVHRLFEQQVARNPGAVAVVCAGTSLTYQQLNERANQLAHKLRLLGVGPETPVGLCLPRSLELAVGVLGILKAGGAYLPLDVESPMARLGLILRDAQPPVLVLKTKIPAIYAEVERLPAAARPQLLTMEPEELASQPTTNLPDVHLGADLNRLAYIIYTSGSTGTPKGVLVEHGALVRRIFAVQAHFHYKPSDHVLQFATLSFDAATEELFVPWLSGAVVVMRPENGFASFAELHRLIEAEQLTVLNLPTSYWHAWVEDLLQTGTPVPSCITLVAVGSEVALPERLRVWQELVGSRVRWINGYGPTEATITATLYEAPAEPLHPRACSVPIGHPIAGTEVYVLDEHRRRVPIGVLGELYLGGDGLARGYLHAPELTAERFVPNPFADLSRSQRLYRSGDRVRYRPDGNLEFLGRVDKQIKIRGYRIEPAEIEVVLSQHELVHTAVVVAHTDTFGETSLVAYLVPQPQATSLDFAAIRRFLQEHLPTPMVPTAFVQLAAIPVLPSGKVNRSALPLPGTTAVTDQAPRTPVETQLVDLWTQVLRRERVGIHDDFFQLGGHSLLAMQLLSRLRDVCGIELPLRQLFEQPTVAGLAPLVEQYRATAPPNSRPIIPRELDEMEQLLAGLNALPEARVDALLNAFLAEEGGDI